MKKLIIFDYDGVIADSFPELHKVYSEICENFNKKFPESLEEFRKIYGQTSRGCYKRLGLNEKEIPIARNLYGEKIVKKNVQMFDGVKELIENLNKFYNMIVISRAPERVVKTELEKFGISKYFKETIGTKKSELNNYSKSKMMRKVVKKYSTPENTISIGDRNIDFIESNEAGLKNFILVDYGWGYDLEKIPEYNQKFIIKYPEELFGAIKESFK